MFIGPNKGTDFSGNDQPNSERATKSVWWKGNGNGICAIWHGMHSPEEYVRHKQQPTLPLHPVAHQPNGAHLEDGPNQPQQLQTAHHIAQQHYRAEQESESTHSAIN